MRIIELLTETEDPLDNTQQHIPPSPDQQIGADPEKQSKVNTSVKPVAKKTKSIDGPYNFDGKEYANMATSKKVAIDIRQALKQNFPNIVVGVDTAKDGKMVPSIRIKNVLPKDAGKKILASMYALRPADSVSATVTGTYQTDTYSFTVDNQIVTIILAGKGGKTGGAQVGIQQLRPNKLGLTGDNTKAQVVELVKKSLVKVVGQDPKLLEALRQLVDVAAGTRDVIDPDLNEHIKDSINLISQDFGEVLTPIKMSVNDNDIINFPEQSNQPLIDAKVNGKMIAVKSLGGSGNSFAVIQELIDEYEKEINKDPKQVAEEQARMLKLVNEFKKSKGDVKDNLIRVAQMAPTSEASALNDLVGFAPNNYNDMLKAADVILKQISSDATSSEDLYKRYLEAVLPISTSGARMTGTKNPKVQAIGMPSDWKHYTGQKDIKDLKAKSSGKKYFDSNFVKAAADQLTYLLGVSFHLDAAEGGKNSEEMSNLITAIMTKKEAIAAKISITPEGGITVRVTPFSDLKFGYQYHAGTSRPSQNSPGFSIHFVDTN